MILKIQIERNQCIMDSIIQEVLSTNEMRMINAYCLYLKVIYLNDITTLNDIDIDINYLIDIKI